MSDFILHNCQSIPVIVEISQKEAVTGITVHYGTTPVHLSLGFYALLTVTCLLQVSEKDERNYLYILLFIYFIRYQQMFNTKFHTSSQNFKAQSYYSKVYTTYYHQLVQQTAM